MATMKNTPMGLAPSTGRAHWQREVESAQLAVSINRRNYVNLLESLHREIGRVIDDPYRHGERSYKLIGDLLDWSVEQRDRLEASVEDVSDAEWERDYGYGKEAA